MKTRTPTALIPTIHACTLAGPVSVLLPTTIPELIDCIFVCTQCPPSGLQQWRHSCPHPVSTLNARKIQCLQQSWHSYCLHQCTYSVPTHLPTLKIHTQCPKNICSNVHKYLNIEIYDRMCF